jgi:hypothetical protein
VNGRNDRQQALAEVELLERLRNLDFGIPEYENQVADHSKELEMYVYNVLKNRLNIWRQRSKNDLEARAWRAMWPLISLTCLLAVTGVLVAPDMLSPQLSDAEVFRCLTAGLGVLAVAASLTYLITRTKRRKSLS